LEGGEGACIPAGEEGACIPQEGGGDASIPKGEGGDSITEGGEGACELEGEEGARILEELWVEVSRGFLMPGEWDPRPLSAAVGRSSRGKSAAANSHTHDRNSHNHKNTKDTTITTTTTTTCTTSTTTTDTNQQQQKKKNHPTEARVVSTNPNHEGWGKLACGRIPERVIPVGVIPVGVIPVGVIPEGGIREGVIPEGGIREVVIPVGVIPMWAVPEGGPARKGQRAQRERPEFGFRRDAEGGPSFGVDSVDEPGSGATRNADEPGCFSPIVDEPGSVDDVTLLRLARSRQVRARITCGDLRIRTPVLLTARVNPEFKKRQNRWG